MSISMIGLPKALPTVAVLLMIISCPGLALAQSTLVLASPPPMEPGHPDQGSVSGRVTMESTGQGLSGAYVAIVNAANVSQAFYEGQADENGYYQFPAVNNTMAGDSTALLYRTYASLAGAGEGISSAFGVQESSTAGADVVIANAGSTSSGFVVRHVPMPDEVRLSAEPGNITTGGNVSVITARLYLNGEPYQRSGVTITFFCDNDTIGYLPAEKKSVSDASGRATTTLTSGNVSGPVGVTGYSHIGISRNITGTCTVHVISLAREEVVKPLEDPALDVNGTEVSNTTGAPENTTPTASPDAAEVSATAGPGQIVYSVLAVVLVVTAGFAAYMLVFRKK